MFDYLPKNIIVERNLIRNADSPGAVLRRLPHLLKALRFTKDTKPFISKLENDLEITERTFRRYEEEAILWLKSSFLKLKQSRYADDPLVKPAMKVAEDLLLNRLWKPQDGINFKGYIDNALEALGFAVDAIANFGPDPIFDGWVELNTGFHCPSHDRLKLEESGGQVKYLKYSERWKLIESFGSEKLAIPIFPLDTKGDVPLRNIERGELREIFKRNFECWVVEPPRIEIDKEGKKHEYCQGVSLRYGFIKAFNYPSCIEELRYKQSKQWRREWSEVRDSDPKTMYGYLKILGQYEGFECATFPPKKELKNWEDVESYIVQANTGCFLSSFSSENSDEHPHSLQQLQSMVDQFLSMVSGNLAQKDLIKGGERKSMLSQEAEEFCIRELVSHVKNLSEVEISRFTYTVALEHLEKIGKLQGINGISETLVRERAGPEAKKQLKEMGIKWKQKGGRPKKNNKKV